MKACELINKRVLVAGLGLTGLSVVRFLQRNGVSFEVADERDANQQLPAMDTMVVRHNQFTAELFCSFDVIVLSPGIARAHDAVTKALSAGVDVIGDIELFADAVSVPVIAVTGSNGKSTVVAWLSDVMNACNVQAKACGNIGEPALDALTSNACVLVLELSSYQLESTRSLRPLAACVLNISEDHLDRYDDIEHYAATKRKIYHSAAYCLANHEQPLTWPGNIHSANESQVCEFFSVSAAVRNEVRWPINEIDHLALSLPGEHNRANALVVLALSSAVDIPLEQSMPALALFTGLPHRSQLVAEQHGVRWFNDSKGTNVDACEKAILAMQSPVILIAGGMAKGADFSVLQPTLAKHVKLLLLMGQDKQLIADELVGSSTIVMVDSLQDAIKTAHSHAVVGDAVLLSPACASFDMFKSFEDRGEQFVAAVHEVLAA